MRTVEIFVGEPGAGKTYLAEATLRKQYATPLGEGGVVYHPWARSSETGYHEYHCCPDEFFTTRSDLDPRRPYVYLYDKDKLSASHEFAFRKFMGLAVADLPYIAVEKVAAEYWQVSPFVDVARLFGWEVKIRHVACHPSFAAKHNVLGVPEATVYAFAAARQIYPAAAGEVDVLYSDGGPDRFTFRDPMVRDHFASVVEHAREQGVYWEARDRDHALGLSEALDRLAGMARHPGCVMALGKDHYQHSMLWWLQKKRGGEERYETTLHGGLIWDERAGGWGLHT